MKYIKSLNEGMTSLQKKVRDEIDGMAINHYANVQNEFGVEDDNEMYEFITGLSDSDAKKLLQQIKKKMFEGKLNEARMKKVDKNMWRKFNDDKRYDALLSVVKDPDEAEKYINTKWNDLPSGFERDMTIYEGKLDEEDYKYKKQVAKAFDKINDEMFNFRHSMGLKQLTNKDMKLKKKVESMQQAIFDLQKEMKIDGLTEAKDTKLAKLFQQSLKASVKDGEDKLYKLSQDWESWNVDNDDKYDDLVDPLFMAVELVQDAGEPGKNNVTKDKEYYSYIKSADKHLKQFNKDAKKALKGLKEGKLTEGAVKDLMIMIDNGEADEDILKAFPKLSQIDLLAWQDSFMNPLVIDKIPDSVIGEAKVSYRDPLPTKFEDYVNEVASSKDGGAKSSGKSHEGDHKKKSIIETWKETYGEDFHSHYPAIAKILKQRPGIDKRELKRIWSETYEEDFDAEYPALWAKLD